MDIPLLELFSLVLIGWLLFVSLISGALFYYDKKVAKKSRQRIPERVLHLLEVLGGAFANLILMYFVRHKNRKFSYWIWTWLIAIGWCVMLMKFMTLN